MLKKFIYSYFINNNNRRVLSFTDFLALLKLFLAFNSLAIPTFLIFYSTSVNTYQLWTFTYTSLNYFLASLIALSAIAHSLTSKGTIRKIHGTISFTFINRYLTLNKVHQKCQRNDKNWEF